MITLVLPAEDCARIAYVLRDYAYEDYHDAETEAANGHPGLLNECAHLDYLARLLDPQQIH